MEGYLVVRHWGGRTERLWVVLDGQQLACFEQFDRVHQEPLNIKKVLQMKNAAVSKWNNSNSRKDVTYGVNIICEGTTKKRVFECHDANSWSAWFNALEVATKLHIEEQLFHEAPLKHARLLGLEQEYVDGSLTMNKISRAYKKLCLKAHPDKGGDVTVFNEINNAYSNLQAIQNEEEMKQKCTVVDYEVIIEKAGQGIGLGLNVAEDKQRKTIVVRSVNENIKLLGISEEAGGVILPEDALIAVEKDDCTHWKMSRIKARLNAFRVPLGSSVTLTLERRVEKSESDIESICADGDATVRPESTDVNASSPIPVFHAVDPKEDVEPITSPTVPPKNHKSYWGDIDEGVSHTTAHDSDDSVLPESDGEEEDGKEEDGKEEGFGNINDIDTEIADFEEERGETVEADEEPMFDIDEEYYTPAGGHEDDVRPDSASISDSSSVVAEKREILRQEEMHQRSNQIQRTSMSSVGSRSGSMGSMSGLQGHSATPSKEDREKDSDEDMVTTPLIKVVRPTINNNLQRDKSARMTTPRHSVNSLSNPNSASSNSSRSNSDSFYKSSNSGNGNVAACGTGSIKNDEYFEPEVDLEGCVSPSAPSGPSVTPSSAYSDEINEILSNSANDRDIIQQLIKEFSQLKESNERFRKINSTTQNEISRLQQEVRSNRLQIKEQLNQAETSQLDLIELTKKNENLVSGKICEVTLTGKIVYNSVFCVSIHLSVYTNRLPCWKRSTIV